MINQFVYTNPPSPLETNPTFPNYINLYTHSENIDVLFCYTYNNAQYLAIGDNTGNLLVFLKNQYCLVNCINCD